MTGATVRATGRFMRSRMLVSIALVTSALLGLAIARTSVVWARMGSRSGVLGLIALPVIIVLLARSLRYPLVAPAMLFALSWTFGLAMAQLPFFPSFEWTREMWVLVTIPPLALFVGALVASPSAHPRIRPLGLRERPHLARGDHRLLLAYLLIGGTAALYEFKRLGGIPLLGSQVDVLRLSLSSNQVVHLVTRFLPVAVILSGIGALHSHRRERLAYWIIGGIATLLLLAQGSRLSIFMPFVVIAFVAYFTLGLTRRSVLIAAVLVLAVLGISIGAFFYRTGQHRQGSFEAYFYNVVASRSPIVAYLTPAQLGFSASFYTLSELVRTMAFESDGSHGYYSFHGLRRLLPARNVEEVAARSVGALITPTYLGAVYGDFGVGGAVVFSLACGVAYGVFFARTVRRKTMTRLVLYAYAMFWLAFFIYQNIYTQYVFWVLDLFLLWLGARQFEVRRVEVGQVDSSERKPA